MDEEQLAILIKRITDTVDKEGRRSAVLDLRSAMETAQELSYLQEHAVEPLASLLSDPDVELAASAMATLEAAKAAGMSIDAAVPAMQEAQLPILIWRISDTADTEGRQSAVLDLRSAMETADVGHKKYLQEHAIEPLASLLSDPDVKLGASAMATLEAAKAAGMPIDAVIPAIARASTHKSYIVRISAIRSVGPFVKERPELVPVLLEALGDMSSVVANRAIEPLEGFIKRCEDRKKLETMRARAREMLKDAKSEQLKRAMTLLDIRICELDYPKLRPRERAAAKVGNFGRRIKLAFQG